MTIQAPPELTPVDIADVIGSTLGIGPATVKQAAVLDPIPDKVWDFACRCAWTYDQRATEFHRELESPFPQKPYLQFLLESIEREPLVWIEKSSQILVSWALAVWALHDVLTHRGHDGAWFCLDRVLATKHLEERILRLYNRIPETYAKPFARIIGGNFEVYHDGTDHNYTSSISAMAQETSVSDQAAKRTRSWTWTWAHIDEAAFTRKQEELIGTLQNRCGKIIAPSTPDGPSTYHHRIGYAKTLASEDAFKLIEPENVEKPMRGVKTWRRFGWFCIDVGYEADPEKDPGRPEGQAWWNHPSTIAARAVTPKWRREMERDSTIAAGHTVFVETDKITRRSQDYYSHLRLIRGHDYSFCNSVAIATQLRQSAGRWKLHILREVGTEDSDIEKHKAHCVDVFTTVFGKDAEAIDYGDHSATQRTSTGVIIERMRPQFNLITHATPPGGVLLETDLTQSVISQGLIELDPEHCPMLWRSLESGYLRDENGDPIQDHPWSDYARALGSIITHLFELHPLAGGFSIAALKEDFQRNPAARAEVSAPYRNLMQDVNVRSDGVVLPRQRME